MAIPNAPAFIKQVVDTLVGEEKARMSGLLLDIITDNTKFYPETPHHGFTYNGGFYDKADIGRGARTRVQLHNELWPRMDEYVRIRDQILTDHRLISQMMAPLLMSCFSTQDVRDALPEILVGQIVKSG